MHDNNLNVQREWVRESGTASMTIEKIPFCFYLEFKWKVNKFVVAVRTERMMTHD